MAGNVAWREPPGRCMTGVIFPRAHRRYGWPAAIESTRRGRRPTMRITDALYGEHGSLYMLMNAIEGV